MTLSICVGSDAITYAAGAAQALAASDGSKKNTHDSTQSRTFGHNFSLRGLLIAKTRSAGAIT
jgi:hypothetical protein